MYKKILLNIWFSSLPFLIIVGAMTFLSILKGSHDISSLLCLGFFFGCVIANTYMMQFFDKELTSDFISTHARTLHICYYALMFVIWVIGWGFFDWTWRSLVALIGTILIVQAVRISADKHMYSEHGF